MGTKKAYEAGAAAKKTQMIENTSSFRKPFNARSSAFHLLRLRRFERGQMWQGHLFLQPVHRLLLFAARRGGLVGKEVSRRVDLKKKGKGNKVNKASLNS